MKTKQTPAKKERAEQIKNAQAAYKRGEITAEFLAWYRRFTAKYITPTNGA